MTVTFLRRFCSVAVGLLWISLVSCKSTKKGGDYSGVVDYTTPDTNLSQEEYPFDEKGNYLADVVSGKKKGSKNKKGDPPENSPEPYDQPPESAVAATSPNYETPPSSSSDPYAPVYSAGNSGSGSTRSKSKTSSSSSKSKSTAKAKPKPKPNPKPKPKPKPKPQSSTMSYAVKKGDTLYAIASRYGTSVAAIKKANGLSSDLLRDGRTIKIPRK